MIIRDSYLHFFGKDVPFYGILFVLGFAVAIITAIPKTKKLGLPRDEVVYSAIFAAIGGILGAKLLSILLSIEYIVEYHIPFVDIIRNGFVFYGGLLGGALGLLIYSKAFKTPLLPYLDLYAAGTALGHAIGRIGCLLSGCCYGIPTDGFFFVRYLHAADPNTPLETPLLPIQLIESFCLIGVYLICEILFYRTERTGVSALVYSLLYPAVRFTLEFFRGDALRGVYGGISTSQIISLAVFAFGLGCFVYRLVRARRKKSPPSGGEEGTSAQSG